MSEIKIEQPVQSRHKMLFPISKVMVIAAIFLVIFWALLIRYYRPLYDGPVSNHFDGRTFYYKGEAHTFTGMLRWMWEMETVPWPNWVSDPTQPKPVERVNKGALRVTYINHATVLIQMDGLNILTDPIWSESAGPVSWLGTKRVRAPGINIEDLPPIDVILISHDHYDHLDMKTLNQLINTYHPLILTGFGVKSLLSANAMKNTTEMDWWQEYTFSPVKFTFVPARHNSGRTLWGDNKTLWGGFVMEGASGKVYFAGDTAYDDFLYTIKDRFGQFRLTILPIGSYEKRWFMKTQHMNPEDTVKVHLLLGSNQSMGIHYATFVEHPEQTIDAHEKDLLTELKKNNLPKTQFWVLSFGEGRDVP